ncbi:C40 family peptidase [Ornithinimicrobium sp. Y1694]|uniref:C40 family peptidase n=1 Tax=Ornithinimicrobium sp. Y1694 TaxID=3418590 RepID=UPI003CE90B64
MKSIGFPKHRNAGTSNRGGVAALMIGGLVAGTVAAAGATVTLAQGDDTSERSDVATALLNDVSTAVQETPEDADRSADVAELYSASLSELRDQGAADRSQARSAPEDADGVSTVLADSAFTGTTLEVAEPVEEVTEEVVTEEAAEEVAAPAQTESTQQQSTQQQAAQQTQQAPAQQQTQQAPARQQTQTQSQPTQQAPAPAPAPAPVGGSLFDIAASYVGYPYVLYGTPPQAFDCSAYTWWVFKQAGIDIPRTVAGQKAAVTPVSNPQPGDLVFYNDFYHVGIYAGNGMTYEALNPSTGVRYGPLVSSNVWYGRIG